MDIKEIVKLTKEKKIKLNQFEVFDLVNIVKDKKGLIFPKTISDMIGSPIVEVNKLMILLSVEKNLYNHYCVPKYKDKVYPERAEKGFSFNGYEDLLMYIEDSYSESLKKEVELITAYKLK